MDKNIDYYFTIKDVQRAEIKIKSSKFIATVSSVNSLDNAIDFLSKIRAEFFDATHNCFAYRIGWDGSTFRASDDGEPSGSAGKPILFSIQKFDVSDVIVVVTRYFGGTKLGVGGLVRAYSDAAELALEKCEKQIINRTKSVKINCRYEEISIIKRLIEHWAVSFEETYSDAVEIIANIHISKVEQFAATVKTATNAKVKVTIL
ncbi:MAG: YigZ family protein [Bacteroidetes bacterium]|nr:YigZ family protein [Bacteroidota bacterium]